MADDAENPTCFTEQCVVSFLLRELGEDIGAASGNDLFESEPAAAGGTRGNDISAQLERCAYVRVSAGRAKQVSLAPLLYLM